MRGVISLLLLLGLFLSVAGCRAVRPLRSAEADSVEVRLTTHYSEQVRLVPVQVEIPASTICIERIDTCSFLESEWASSEARISADGVLYHDLCTKPRVVEREAAVVDARSEIVRDSVVVERVREVVEVPRELTLWQRLLLYSGVALWAVVLWRVVRLFL